MKYLTKETIVANRKVNSAPGCCTAASGSIRDRHNVLGPPHWVIYKGVVVSSSSGYPAWEKATVPEDE